MLVIDRSVRFLLDASVSGWCRFDKQFLSYNEIHTSKVSDNDVFYDQMYLIKENKPYVD